jgi:predicted GH43/DUF377 family glycosyl hydrolase
LCSYVTEGHAYRTSTFDGRLAAPFDPKRPSEIMAQMSYPWLEPTTHEDRNGLVSNVTFVEGLVHFKGTWFAYYGQSDSTLGVATYRVATPGASWPDRP